MTKRAKPQKPMLRMPEGIKMGTKPDPAYWQALGEFIEMIANVETMTFYLLTLYAAVTPDHAAALFSGTRLLDAMKLIRRIIASAGAANKRHEELELLFAQLTAINAARNDIVHYGSIETVDFGRVTSNWTRAHIPENITVRPMSIEMLRAMTA